VNYRTGDRVEWINDCSCGLPDRRFKLLGRIDNIIQIWSCRLLVSDVEATLAQKNIMTYQMKITEQEIAGLVKEIITLSYELPLTSFNQEEFLLDLYNRSRDVKDTIDFTSFKENMLLTPVDAGLIPRNPRTGKISTVLDTRR
jgi:phenylacetate-coenzyme A ligase PaaK-like adenylate-forming protein